MPTTLRASNATRIQTSGGTNTLKYLWDAGLGLNGVAYVVSLLVQNNGTQPITISCQYATSQNIQPGQSEQVFFSITGTGALDVQIRFQTNASGDSMDVIAVNPIVAKTSDNLNLVPSVNQNFSGWTAFSGAAATLTQGQLVPVLGPAMETFLSQQGGMFVPVLLLDIQTLDGTKYFWSDYEGYYPSKFLAGTRIQSTGGSSRIKFLINFGSGVAGHTYAGGIAVKNQGATVVSVQLNGGGPVLNLQPGQSGLLASSYLETGNNCGVGVPCALILLFQTANIGDAMDVVACNPSINDNGGPNLITGAALTFGAAWAGSGGNTVTLTQGYDVAPFQFYNGWIKSGCNFTCTKDMSSNAGDLLLQNISGNTIDRDVAAALKNHEFEGAYAVTRLWVPLLDVAIREFHCSLTEQNPKEDEAGFRELQLFDPTQYVIAGDVQVETCTFRFKSAQCGSTGSAGSCPKRLIDCQDATRLAQERYPGILTTMPNTVNVPPLAGIGPRPPRPVPGGGRRPLPIL